MKKKLLIVILILIFALIPLSAYAESDIQADDTQTDDAQTELSDELAEINAHCLCGREYYSETEDGHSAFDCTKCGQNMYSCTCNCWCGAETFTDTSGKYGSVSPRICAGCSKPCIFCDCRSDREAVLIAEQQRRTGDISSLNILRPKNAVLPVLAVFFALLLVSLGIVADRFGFFDKIAAKLPEESDGGEEEPEEEEEEESVPQKPVQNAVQEKPPVNRPVQENRSSGVYRLYKTIAVTGKNRPEKSPFVPADDPDISFTENEIAIIMNVLSISPNGISPFTVNNKKNFGDTLANLITEGLIIKTDDGLKAEENVGKYITEIAAPKTAVSFDTFFSGRYTLCTAGGDWYAVNGKNGADIRIFADINALCDWISDVFSCGSDEKSITAAEIYFDYNEFSLYSLTQLLGVNGSFEADDMVRPDICEKLREGLEEEGFFRTADTFSALSRKEVVEEVVDEMAKKGILSESDGRFTASKTVDSALSTAVIKDCVYMKKNGGSEFEVLFALRENGATAIYDNGSGVRVISAPKIPWKQYLA